MMISSFSPTGNICINSKPLPCVTKLSENEKRSSHPVIGFGDSLPSSVITFSQGWSIELECADEKTAGKVPTGEEFTLTVDGRTYSGCRTVEKSKTEMPDGSRLVRLVIYAAGRQEA